ncbi:conserved hypothetical protein [Gammaproteobacteria bacterium]
MTLKKIRKNFSSFNANEALQALQINELFRWEIEIEIKPYKPSHFLAERLRRLENFDLIFSERAKELLIDALCEEVIEKHHYLKIWKAAPLHSDEYKGQVDYLIAPRKAYLSTPLLCVVEAKKDDFEQGLAQCLVEMKACQWNNEQAGSRITVYAIVTNGEVWKFYQLTIEGQVFATLPYSLADRNKILAILEQIFTQCENNLSKIQIRAC